MAVAVSKSSKMFISFNNETHEVFNWTMTVSANIDYYPWTESIELIGTLTPDSDLHNHHKGEYTMNLHELDVRNSTLETLFLAITDLTTISEGYDYLELDAPEWVGSKLDQIDAELGLRKAAELKRLLDNAEARLETLKTREEKRADIELEIERLKDAMG